MIAGDQREELLGMAAVSHFIDPAVVAARTGQDPSAVAELLLSEIETELDDRGNRRWMLRTARRREVLGRADQGSVRRWLGSADQKPETDVEEVLQRWLGGEIDIAAAARQSRDTVQRVASWLSDCQWLTPRARDATHFIEIEGLRAHLQMPAGAAFYGRQADLDWLTEAVAGPPRAAVIEAAGGMGKSALLARWLVDQHALTEWNVAIFVDFDDPAMNVLNPDYLFAEIARQAAIQVPAVEDFHQEMRRQISESKQRRGERNRSFERGLDDSRSASVLFSLFGTVSHRAPRVTVVLDTVERALRGPRASCDQIIDSLRSVLGSNPSVALVIAGRGPIELRSLEGVPRRKLGPLAAPDAARLLRNRGVLAPFIARILARVPASPLTLRLAARAGGTLGFDALDDVALDRAIEAAEVDGYLHARVLSHLPSKRLAGVARVALLLQTLTADQLLDIVGPLADPPIRGGEEAARLFSELASVSDLAAIAAPNHEQLTLRPELFEEVTRLLHAEDADLSARLHARAAAILGRSKRLADRDASEYHARALAELSGAKNSSAAPLRTSTTRRQLRSQVPALLKAGHNASALELVTTQASAQGDAALLLLGARAARLIGDTERCEELPRRALSVAETPLHRAQAWMYLAWAAEDRLQVEDAHRRLEHARDALAQIPEDDGNLAERAELIAGLAVDNRKEAVNALQRIFATPHAREALLSADLDLIRQIAALVGTPEMLAFAADAKAFEHSPPLDFTGLMTALLGHPEMLKRLSLPGDLEAGRAAFENLQRSRALSSAISYIVLDAHDDPKVREALAELLERMREPVAGKANPRAKPLDPSSSTKRAEEIDSLVDSLLISEIDLPSMFEEIEAGIFKLGKRDARAEVLSSILKIDRMRLGEKLVRQLEVKGLEAEAALASHVFDVGAALPEKEGS